MYDLRRSGDPDHYESRYKILVLVILFINILISLMLIVGGIIYNSISLLSNGSETFIDIFSFSVTIYLSLVVAQKPPDISHQY